MVDLKITIEGDEFTKKQLKKMQRRANDLRPVFREFIKFYQDDIIPASFETKGALMGKKWAGSQDKTGRYTKRKSKDPKNLSGSGGINLQYTFKMYNAARGHHGWFQKIRKDDFLMGIKGSVVPYANRHQTGGGGFSERPFFLTTKGTMPQRATTQLIKMIREYVTEGQ